MLYHVSEESGICRFDPRPSHHIESPVVWAIHEDRLQNYLVPRNCPRVTFYAGNNTSDADVERFLGSSSAVVALETSWWKRVEACRLFCYEMPPESFSCFDDCAGYFISHEPVEPVSVRVYDNAANAILSRGVELRVLRNLRPLRDAVVASTLRYSVIAMRDGGERDVRAERG